MDIPEGVLVGFGNPLLDITVVVEDNTIVEKYELRLNTAIIAEEEHGALFDELSNMEQVIFSAGGACQNSLRVFQWMVNKPFSAYFVGAVGKDSFGEKIAKRAQADGVRTVYQLIDSVPTGTCAIIMSDTNRSLVASLGAAANFNESWLDDEENLCIVERAEYVYVTGYFLAVNSETVLGVAKIACENNRIFIFNFSAVFVLQTNGRHVDEILPYTDLVICNKQEALTYSNLHKWETSDIFEVGQRLRSLPKENLRPRIVMIFDTTCPILCFQENDRVLQYSLPKVDKSSIVDANGCSDSFVGGFLSQFVQHMPIDYCIRAGAFAYQQIMRVVGVQINKLPDFKGSCI